MLTSWIQLLGMNIFNIPTCPAGHMVWLKLKNHALKSYISTGPASKNTSR